MKTPKFIILLFGAILIALTINAAHADMPSGYMEYFVPGSEEQMRDIFVDLQDAFTIGDSMHTVITLVAAGDSIDVYYDHWEDGYDLDPNNLAATADEHFFFASAGDVLSLESSGIPANPRDSTQIYYDGQDHFLVVGGLIATSRASWPEKTGTVLALALEFFSIHAQDTNYIIPVGENLVTALGYNDFINTYVIAMAVEDGTSIEIDDPKTPGVEVSVTLDKGEVTQLFHIDSHTSINASKPVQVNFAVGDPNETYEMRGYVALPSTFWSNNYYNPVPGFGTDGATDLYIFNPNAFNITVNYEDLNGSGNFVVSAGATKSYEDGAGRTVPVNSGVNLASADTFVAMGSADTESSTYDWGFTLLPKSWLTSDTYIGWAPGTSEPTPTSNGSPLFVTPINDTTTIYVDYSPTDGVVDVTYTLDRLEVQKIFDPDNNNTGMHVYGTDDFAIMWGEDPNTASGGNPYLDMGYTVLPLVKEFIDIVLTLDKTANPDELPQSGGNVRFTLQILSYDYSVDSVDVTDLLPTDWAYVADSTIITLPDESQITGPAANPSITGQELFWNTNVNMNTHDTLIIDFMAQPISPVDTGYHDNYAYAQGTRFGDQYFTPHDHAYVYVTPLPDIEVTKTDSVSTASPGDTLTYTITISNNGSRGATGIDLTDTLDANVSFVSASDGGTHASGVVSWPAFGLTGGNSTTRTVTVAVDNPLSPGVTQIFNVAVAYDDGNNGQDPNLNNNRGTDTDNVIASPLIEATKTDTDINGGDLEPGDTLLYTIVISNSGDMGQGDNAGNEFEDSIPVNTSYVTGSVSASSGTVIYNGTQNRIEWNGGIAAGDSVTITFKVALDSPLACGTVISNQGTVNWDSDGNNTNDSQEPTDDPDTPQDDDATQSSIIAEPLADFCGTPTSGCAPLTVNFTDLSTNNPTSWKWYFGDGDSSSAQNPQHTYNSADTFTVMLITTNACGSDTMIKSDYIKVTTKPTADFCGTPTSGCAPLQVSFTDLSTNNPTSWKWYFGDGDSSALQNPQHTYTSVDTFTVTLIATNDCGSDTMTKTDYIKITGTKPVADFSASPTSGCVPLTVDFTDLSTNNPTSWKWYFGDGDSCTLQNPQHIYTSVDTFTVTLIATNQCGSDTMIKTDYIKTYACTPFIEATKTDTDVNGGYLEPGDTLLYTIVISNTGNIDQGDNAGNEFEDSIPTNTNYITGSVSASSDTATYNGTENRIEWNGSIAAGDSVTIMFKVVLHSPLSNGTIICNQGTVNWDCDGDDINECCEPTDDPDTPEDDDPTKSTVTSAPFIEATKTDTDVNGGYLEPGETLLYTIVISNTGNMNQGNNTGNEFEDPIPVNTTFDNSYTPTATSGTVTYNAGLEKIEWNGSIAAGSSITITFRVVLDFPLANGTVISNQGTVNWDCDGDDANECYEPTDDPDTPEEDDPTLSIVTAFPLIKASKYDQLSADVDSNGMASPGDLILYTITISNSGKAPATNVTFSDTPDSNTTLVVGSVITTQGAIASGNNSGDNSVVVNIGTIPIGHEVYIAFKITIDEPFPIGITQIANQGYVSSTELPDEPTDDPHTPVDDDPTKTPVTAIPIIEIYKTDSLFGDILGDGVFGSGDTILYKISIFNSGNTAATRVTFTDTPDTNTALVVGSVTTSQGIIVSGNNTGDDSVIVNIDTIPSQGSVIIRFLASINDPLPADIERLANQGYVNSNELPPEFTDDSDTPLEDDSTLTAIGVPDIDLSDDSHNYGGVPAGDCSSWTLVVCNVGTAALEVYSIESDNPLFVVDSPSFPQIIAPSGCIDVVLKFCPPIGDCCLKVANITITSNDPDEEILTVTLQGRGICPSISGKVTYYSNSAPIKDVTMTLSGGESRTITTYNTGFYVFQDLVSKLDYTVTPSKQSTESDPAISAYDAGLLLQHIVGANTISEYQQIAGDVSGNEGLSSYDVSLILQYSAYLIDHFPANDWAFMPESRNYTSLISDYHNQDYLGILTGDVSGNWSYSNKKAISFTPNVSVWVPETTCVPGDTVMVPLYISDITELGVISAGIILTFDANAVSALEASLGDIVSSDWLIESNVKPGQIVIAMAGAVPLGGTGKLVKIPFIIGSNAGMDITIHIDRCQFNEGGISTGLQDGKISIVTGIEEYSYNTIPVTYELSQNVPNPFAQGITTVSYSLPAKSNVNLKIYDVTGQLIRTLVNEQQEPGHYAVSWDSKDEMGKSVAPGVYFYCIKAGAYNCTKKMVLLR